MDANNLPNRPTPHWDLYRKECFNLAKEESQPLFSTDPEDLEKLAHEKLSAGGWLYANSNAGESRTHRANREGESMRVSSGRWWRGVLPLKAISLCSILPMENCPKDVDRYQPSRYYH